MKDYFRRIIVGGIVGVTLSFAGITFGDDEIEVLFTVYGIVFSVFVSFGVSFSTREIRNPKTRDKVIHELRALIKGTILDFITTSVLYSIYIGIGRQEILLRIYSIEVDIVLMLSTTLYTLMLLFVCVTALKFLKLRNLQNLLEGVGK